MPDIVAPVPDPTSVLNRAASPEQMRELGRQCWKKFTATPTATGQPLLIGLLAEDADGFGDGLVEAAIESGEVVRIACLWMRVSRLDGRDVAQILQEFVEPIDDARLVVAVPFLAESAKIASAILRLSDGSNEITVAAPFAIADAADDVRRRLGPLTFSTSFGAVLPGHPFNRTEPDPLRGSPSRVAFPSMVESRGRPSSRPNAPAFL